jgi:hypothetical protein
MGNGEWGKQVLGIRQPGIREKCVVLKYVYRYTIKKKGNSG